MALGRVFETLVLLGVLMPKAEWGVKRLCAACGARFYDLGRQPVDCPKCGETYVAAVAQADKGKVTKATAKKAAVVEPDEEAEDEDIALVDDDDDAIEEPLVETDDDDDDDETAADSVLLADDDDDDDDLGDFAAVDNEEKDT